MPPNSGDVTQNPITHDEMRALLEPMQSCLQRMERVMQELSCTLPPAYDCLGIGSRAPDSGKLPTAPTTPSSRGQCELTPRHMNIRVESNEADQETLPIDKLGSNGIGGIGSPKDLLHKLNITEVLNAKGLADHMDLTTRAVLKLEAFHHWWSSLKEPRRDSCVYRLSTSRHFDTLCMVIIMFNSALVAYTADWRLKHIGVNEPSSFEILETCCLAWFVFELILRLLAHRQYFFVTDIRWNVFDLTIVTISVVSFGFEAASKIKGSDVGFMRQLRILKLAKILGSLRSFRFVKALQLLLDSLERSCQAFFWGFVMLAFIIYLFSQIFMQAMIEHISSDDFDLNTKSDAMEKLGSLGATFLSLYMAVTGGDDWINLYDVIVQTGWMYGLVLVFFTLFFIFALFNVMTALIVEKAMTGSKPDRAQIVLEKRMKIAEERETFLQVCLAMDKDGDGVISWEEFQEWMCHPVMLSYMASIGIEIHDVELFFTHVGARAGRDGNIVSSGEVTIEHFVEGLMHMKGSATALDMQRQLFELHVLHHDVKHLNSSISKKLRGVEQLIRSSLDPQTSANHITAPALSLPETRLAKFRPLSL